MLEDEERAMKPITGAFREVSEDRKHSIQELQERKEAEERAIACENRAHHDAHRNRG